MNAQQVTITLSLDVIKIHQLHHISYTSQINHPYTLIFSFSSDTSPKACHTIIRQSCQLDLSIDKDTYYFDGYIEQIQLTALKHQHFVYQIIFKPHLAKLNACYTDIIFNDIDVIAMTKLFAFGDKKTDIAGFLNHPDQLKIALKQPNRFQSQAYFLMEGQSHFDFLRQIHRAFDLNFYFDHRNTLFVLSDSIHEQHVIQAVDFTNFISKQSLLEQVSTAEGEGLLHAGERIRYKNKTYLVKQSKWEIKFANAHRNALNIIFNAELADASQPYQEANINAQPLTSIDNVLIKNAHGSAISEHQALNKYGHYTLQMPPHWQGVGRQSLKSIRSLHLMHSEDLQMNFLHAIGTVGLLSFSDNDLYQPFLHGGLNCQANVSLCLDKTFQNAYFKDQKSNQIGFINNSNEKASFMLSAPDYDANEQSCYMRFGDACQYDLRGNAINANLSGVYFKTEGDYLACHGKRSLISIPNHYQHEINLTAYHGYHCLEKINVQSYQHEVCAFEAYRSHSYTDSGIVKTEMAREKIESIKADQVDDIDMSVLEKHEGEYFNYQYEQLSQKIHARSYRQVINSNAYESHSHGKSITHYGHHQCDFFYNKSYQLHLEHAEYKIDHLSIKAKAQIEKIKHHQLKADEVFIEANEYIEQSDQIFHQGSLSIFSDF